MALPAIVVLALVAIVAIAATGSTSSGSGTTRPPAESLLDMFFTLGLVAVVVGGVLLVYGLTQRKAIARELASGRHRSSLVGWVVLAGVYAALWYFRPNTLGIHGSRTRASRIRCSPTASSPREAGATARRDYEPNISWLAIALVVGLVIAGIVAYVASKRRSRERGADRRGARRRSSRTCSTTPSTTFARRPTRDARSSPRTPGSSACSPRTACHARPAETAQEYVPRVLRRASRSTRRPSSA